MTDTAWHYDAYDFIYEEGRTPQGPGRPNCLQAGVFTMEELRGIYHQVRSVRKTAERLNISPTTVKKYLRGQLPKPGRPVQPKSWRVQIRSELHKWFVANKDRQLPRSTEEIAALSGFSARQINRYLWARVRAMESYLASLPALTDVILVLRDIEGRKVPTNLISSYLYSIDRITGDVTITAVLKMGGSRVIRIPFRDLELALLGKNENLPLIGLVRPVGALGGPSPLPRKLERPVVRGRSLGKTDEVKKSAP